MGTQGVEGVNEICHFNLPSFLKQPVGQVLLNTPVPQGLRQLPTAHGSGVGTGPQSPAPGLLPQIPQPARLVAEDYPALRPSVRVSLELAKFRRVTPSPPFAPSLLRLRHQQ